MIGRIHHQDNYYTIYWLANDTVYGAYFWKTDHHDPNRVHRQIMKTDEHDKQILECRDVEKL